MPRARADAVTSNGPDSDGAPIAICRSSTFSDVPDRRSSKLKDPPLTRTSAREMSRGASPESPSDEEASRPAAAAMSISQLALPSSATSSAITGSISSSRSTTIRRSNKAPIETRNRSSFSCTMSAACAPSKFSIRNPATRSAGAGRTVNAMSPSMAAPRPVLSRIAATIWSL